MRCFPNMRGSAKLAVCMAAFGAAAAFAPTVQAHLTHSSPFDAYGTSLGQLDSPLYVALGSSGHVFVTEGPQGPAALLTALSVDNANIAASRSASVAFVRRIDGSASLILGGPIAIPHSERWSRSDIMGGQAPAMSDGFGVAGAASIAMHSRSLQASYTLYPTIHGGSPLAGFRSTAISFVPPATPGLAGDVLAQSGNTYHPDLELQEMRFERSLSTNPIAGQTLTENLSSAAASTLLMELGGLVPAGQYGQFAVADSSALNGALEILLGHHARHSLEGNFSVVDDRVTPAPDAYSEPILPIHDKPQARAAETNASSPVPEPAALSLAALGAAGLLARRKH